MIVAQTLTDQAADDPSQVAPLLDQIGGPIARVRRRPEIGESRRFAKQWGDSQHGDRYL